ncbi:GH1 family beta-glucosidase [Spirochaetota bacterium]
MSFPKDFIWGAAAASYQIEGAAFEDGKKASVWDMLAHSPGKIWDKYPADTACDHYHRYKEDVKLMAEIGLPAYRLSISWPRVLPDGTGKVNEKGLDFYDKLIDELCANNIQPWVTLFHWDFPQALWLKGGWLNRESADWFAEYVKVIVNKLSDRVSHWMTINEPQCYIGGHYGGDLAPAMPYLFPDALTAAHNTLLAHGRAFQAIRGESKSTSLIGAAPVGVTAVPVSDSKKDIEAVRKYMFSVCKKDFNSNTWFADPMILGEYPKDGLELFKEDLPEFPADDMKVIKQPLDFYGANIYNGRLVKHHPEKGFENVQRGPGPELTTMGWRVTPESLYWGPKMLYERYKLPIVITENGIANMDWVHLDGKVHDPQRIDFLTRYLGEFKRAIADGLPALGYFHWSIMDNFEWRRGFSQRFGLIHVDYTSYKRTLKDSAYWYSDVIKSNGANI